MASWSWRGTKARPTQAAPAARRPAVGGAPASSVVIPHQARPTTLPPDDEEQEVWTSLGPPLRGNGTADEPLPDAHLRRALALAELSRLVLDAD